MSALRLLYSVHGSLFLRWTFFICTISSSVSSCFRVLLLRSVTRSDLRFYLSDGVARWDESLLFLFAPSCSTLVVSSAFGQLFHVFLPSLCIRNLLPSFLFLPGFVPSSLLVGVVPFICSAFSFRLAFLTCMLPLLLLSFAFLPFPPWGALSFPSLVRGFSLPGISSFVLLSLHTWSLRVSFFLSWFRPFPLVCSSSPLCVLSSCLFRPWAFSFAYWFLSSRSSSYLFLFAWCFL